MAKSLTELSGKWTMSKELSSDVTPVLEIQGVNFVMRKAAASAPVYLEISQKGKEEVRIAQTTTAGIPGINEEWYFDDQEREHKDSFLGRVKSKSRWISLDQVGDGFLKDGLGKDNDEVVQAEVVSLDNGWKAVQVWYVAENGHFIRNVVTSKGDKSENSKLVYVRS